ncbi:phosphotransferase family protein [Polycladomyces subterraneus]|uniref:Aminoglycoside phosphotransferase family protein n=1 Tax=Polycladomyces subterraneus TaxID=1016997 RepID=A0ABT8IKG7_9BACL|nr:aminoglycoside phosphotransferase family protein [Polycladomyces subterraneus]MDN4592649.1 aminoglycoside phosphotransferase family protein [Polycladomyces subterraneus]
MIEQILEKLMKRYGALKITPLKGGYTNSTVLMDGTEPLLVAKIARRDNQDTLNEIGCLGLLKGENIIPSLYETFDLFDFRIMIMDYREGINGQFILDDHKWNEAIELYKLLGISLASHIHAIAYRADGCGIIRKSSLGSLREMVFDLDFVPLSLKTSSDEILSIIKESESEWVLTHGDYGPHNILISQGKQLSVLDWEWAEWAHPLNDLAWVYWFTNYHYPDEADLLFESFINGYVLHKRISYEPNLIKAYCIDKILNILLRVKNAAKDVQDEWIRRLDWTLNKEFCI